jgi:hypothetical protein
MKKNYIKSLEIAYYDCASKSDCEIEPAGFHVECCYSNNCNGASGITNISLKYNLLIIIFLKLFLYSN